MILMDFDGMFLILDDLILLDEIVCLLADEVLGLLDDGVAVDIFWKCF